MDLWSVRDSESLFGIHTGGEQKVCRICLLKRHYLFDCSERRSLPQRGFRGHLRFFSNFEYKLHKVLSVQNWNKESSSILFFYVMQGQSGWGKFIWFYVLTSEIDNLCTIKGNPNSFFIVWKGICMQTCWHRIFFFIIHK